MCVCDRAITAQYGLRDLTPPNTQQHHRPGHLLFNLTQCAENTAVMDNQMTGHEAPCRKSNYEGFLPSWFCQGVQLKRSLRWMQIHTLLVTFASARQECLPSLIMQALQSIKLFHVSQRVQIVPPWLLRVMLRTGHDGWLVVKQPTFFFFI